MLRLVNTLNVLQISVEPLQKLQNVRWHRKPRWVPTAKSKVFRIPARPQISEVENAEIARLFNNYRTEIKSIRRFLTKKQDVASRQTVDPEVLKQAFNEDFAKCNAINDEWNAKLKLVREARYQEDLSKDINLAKTRVAQRQLDDVENFAKAEELVKAQIAVSHTFITRANIDEAIEKAVSLTVDHNFAIDKDGNKIAGRKASPEEPTDKEKISIKQ